MTAGEMDMLEAIAIATIWYLLITVIKVGLAIAYNALLNQDRDRAIPVCFKVVAGVIGTETLRVVRLIPFLVLVAMYIANQLNVTSAIVVTMIVALMITAWTIDSILAYSAMGIPLIWGDIRRWARNRELERSVAHAQELERKIDEMIKEKLGRG